MGGGFKQDKAMKKGIKNEGLKKIINAVETSPAYTSDDVEIVLLVTDEKTDTSYIITHCSPAGFSSMLINLGEEDEDFKKAIVVAGAKLL